MTRLARNIGYNLAGQAVLMAVGVVAVRFVFKGLGGDAFGIILFATAMGTLVAGLLDLGLSATIVREVSSHWNDDRDYAIALFRTACSCAWAVCAALIVTLAFTAPLIVGHWIDVRSLPKADAIQVLQITGAGALLSLPRVMYAALFRGLQRMAIFNCIEVGWLLLQQAGIAAIVLSGGDLFFAAAWFAVCYALAIVAYLASAAIVLSPSAIVPAFSIPAIRRNLVFALQMTSTSAFGTIVGQADRLLVSKLMPVRTLGYYGFAATVAAAFGRVTYAIVLAAFPAFGEIYRREGLAGLRNQNRQVRALVLAASAPGLAAFVFASHPMFTWVFGERIGTSLMVPAIVLSVGWYLNAAVSSSYFVSLSLGRADIGARQSAMAAFLVLPFGAVATWQFGLTGAASIWVLYHLFAISYGIPRISRECLQEPATVWLWQLLSVLALISVTYGGAYLVVNWLAADSIAWLATAYLLACTGFAVGVKRLLGGDLRGLTMHPSETKVKAA